MTPDLDLGTCDCCGHEPAVGVAAAIGVPMSIAYGKRCLQAGPIQPMWMLLSTYWECGGYMAEWWWEMVRENLLYYDMDLENFLGEAQWFLEESDRSYERYREEHGHG